MSNDTQNQFNNIYLNIDEIQKNIGTEVFLCAYTIFL